MNPLNMWKGLQRNKKVEKEVAQRERVETRQEEVHARLHTLGLCTNPILHNPMPHNPMLHNAGGARFDPAAAAAAMGAAMGVTVETPKVPKAQEWCFLEIRLTTGELLSGTYATEYDTFSDRLAREGGMFVELDGLQGEKLQLRKSTIAAIKVTALLGAGC